MKQIIFIFCDFQPKTERNPVIQRGFVIRNTAYLGKLEGFEVLISDKEQLELD